MGDTASSDPLPPPPADTPHPPPEHAAPAQAQSDTATAAPHRTFRQRLLGIGWKGWVRLAVVCIVVGAILDASGINPFAPNFTLSGAIAALGNGVLNVGGWLISAGWRPLITGALVVIPIWLAWRVATVMLRR